MFLKSGPKGQKKPPKFFLVSYIGAVEFNSFCCQAKLDKIYMQHKNQQFKEQCTLISLVFALF